MFKLNPCNKLTSTGIYDPLSSIIAERNGANSLWLSSFSFCLAQGYPDLGLLPFTAEISTISRILDVTTVPLIVDIDNGFASVEHAGVIAKKLDRLGVHAICIEDKFSPKKSSLYPDSQELLPLKEFSQIIQRMKREAPNLNIIARLEGLNYGQTDELINERISACMNARADCVLLHNTTASIDRLKCLITTNRNVPIGIIPTKYMEKVHSLDNENIVLVVYANQLIRAVHKTIANTMKSLEYKPENIDKEISTILEMNMLVKKDV